MTTIWSAIAVVMHAGQLTLSAPAALIGAITLLWPTIRTIWNETATVVHALQLANANALFVFVTGCAVFHRHERVGDVVGDAAVLRADGHRLCVSRPGLSGA